ncbi:MAG: nucleoside-diphosphate sugar epimerase/dehydratase [Gammaproteobacteria bacterium]|nr:nucleoside-diphosphate sugar epimerase/dehydratase [Gammaproteobacteria bacterium]
MIPLAWFGAYWLRFNLDSVPPLFMDQAVRNLPLVWAVQGLVFWNTGLYRGIWRFASVPDLRRIATAVVAGTAGSALAIFLVMRLAHAPRSVFVLDGLLLVVFLGAPRFLYRAFKDRSLYRDGDKRALIVGAGRAGEMLARDLLRDTDIGYRPVAFVDDDRRRGEEIHGLPVVGSCQDIPAVVNRFQIDILFIAVTESKGSVMRRLIELCESSNRPFRILPDLRNVVDGQVSIRELREVNIEDLLGREPVMLEWQQIDQSVRGKVVVVTGAGGSIGSELCRQIARLAPRTLVLFERGEYNLYAIELELRQRHPDLHIVPALGDVGDAHVVDRTFTAHRPDIVFHAAAYKHVPLLEGQGRAAVRNNVFGTMVLVDAADRHGCGTFLLISTDKAVNPSNIMGATKRAAEIVCQERQMRSKTRFLTVRFGNVLGSAGSVIPLFRQQIAAGGPVTVTHPEITRYFMTIPEACTLILQASVIGGGGEIFVLDMGEPIRIRYLAEQLILLSGKRPDEDIDIVYTGLRPGEKLYEELFYADEQLLPTRHPKIRLAQAGSVDAASFEAQLAVLSARCEEGPDEGIREDLLALIGQPGAPPVAVVPLVSGKR